MEGEEALGALVAVVLSEFCSMVVTRLEYNAWACGDKRKEELCHVKGLRCLWKGSEFRKQGKPFKQEVKTLVETEPPASQSGDRRSRQNDTCLFQVSQSRKGEESSLKAWFIDSDIEDTSESRSGRS